MKPSDYNQLLAEAREGRPFANGTEGYGWMAANCDRCIHDRQARRGREDKGCPLILVALMDRTPAQWLDGPRDEHGLYSIAQQYTCIEFRDENSGPPPGPRRRRTPPGQGELVPRAPFEAVRMLTPLEEAGEVAHAQGRRELSGGRLICTAPVPDHNPLRSPTDMVGAAAKEMTT